MSGRNEGPGGSGGGVKNCPKMRDVIYGRPLRSLHTKEIFFIIDNNSIPQKFKPLLHCIDEKNSMMSQVLLTFQGSNVTL